jgi:hypothetical protein
MLKEVDFSKGVRGKHHGRVHIVGPVESKPADDATGKLRRSLEADLRKLGVLDKLDKEERSALRESWTRKIEKALAD